MGLSKTYKMGEFWSPGVGTIYKFLISWFVIFLIIVTSISLINPIANATPDSTDKPEIEFLKINSDIDNNYAITDIQTKGFLIKHLYPISRYPLIIKYIMPR
jgi:hypothetical protein